MLPPKTETQPINLMPGLTFQWLFEGSAVLFIVSANSRGVIDGFINALNELLTNWDASQPFYCLIDASSSSIAMSPYLSAKVKEPTQIARAARLNGMYYLLRPQGFIGEIVERLGSLFVRPVDTMRLTWVKNIEEGKRRIEDQLARQPSA